MWDAQGFLLDHGIPYEHQRPGWLNIRCPMCEDHGAHGGFFLEDGHYHCWRCGPHWTLKVAARLLGRRESDLRQIHDKYERYTKIAEAVRKKAAGMDAVFALPGSSELSKYHRKYLEDRNFNPDQLVADWELRATAPMDRCFGMEWGARIVIPIKDASGRIVAAQGRDITGKAKARYLGSPIEKSLMDYKDTLFGAHRVRGDSVFVVEGVFDVFRLGSGFVCTFGTTLSKPQLRELRRWRNVGFIFDPEPEAQAKARKYAAELSSVGIDAELIQLDIGGRDPAEMTRTEAQEVRNYLGIRGMA